jgi:hypothetical protein
MFHNETSLFRMKDEAFDDFSSHNTLFRIEVSRRFVNQVDIGRLAHAQHESHTLQLTTRQVLHHLVNDGLDGKGLGDICHELGVEISVFDFLLQKHADCAFKFGADLLGFVAHIQLRNLGLL